VRSVVATHRVLIWTRATLPSACEERYAKRCTAERLSDVERDTVVVVVDDDGQWLLEWLEQEDGADLRELRAVSTLRDVWTVHYERGPGDHMRWTENTIRGGTESVETPHDPDAQWATTRRPEWVGYKLQVTETDDLEMPHVMTDIALTSAIPF